MKIEQNWPGVVVLALLAASALVALYLGHTGIAEALLFMLGGQFLPSAIKPKAAT